MALTSWATHVLQVELGTQTGPPATSRRKAGTTSSHHGPYVLGHTRATMAGTERSEAERRSGPQKAGLSTDRSLQPDCVKLESLVIAHQHGVTPSEPGVPEVASLTERGAVPKVNLVRGVKS